jgi:hypothetical protein
VLEPRVVEAVGLWRLVLLRHERSRVGGAGGAGKEREA